jgi:fructose-1,6-bisphosphatase/sedoheptulose 1,7-bisphosphatase-like protein
MARRYNGPRYMRLHEDYTSADSGGDEGNASEHQQCEKISLTLNKILSMQNFIEGKKDYFDQCNAVSAAQCEDLLRELSYLKNWVHEAIERTHSLLRTL